PSVAVAESLPRFQFIRQRRQSSPVIPSQIDLTLSVRSRIFQMNDGRRRKSVETIDLFPVARPILRNAALKFGRIIDRKNSESGIQNMTSHITQGSCTKRIPGPPAPGRIDRIVIIML